MFTQISSSKNIHEKVNFDTLQSVRSPSNIEANSQWNDEIGERNQTEMNDNQRNSTDKQILINKNLIQTLS